ncbi:MAG: DUF5309 family protein [Promethearchaeota archaeon]
MSTIGTHGISLEGSHNIDGAASGMNVGATNNQVQNEMDFQIMTNMMGMASDLNVTCLSGSYQGAASAATAAKSRGLANAISTNTVAAGSVDLTTDHVNSALKQIFDSGGKFMNMMAVCNSFQRQALTALYSYVPQSRSEGGSKIDKIYTDFCELGIICDPNMTTSSIYFVDMMFVKLTFCPVKTADGRTVLILLEDKSTGGASFEKQIYFQAGLNYGPEEYHASITGLTTS